MPEDATRKRVLAIYRIEVNEKQAKKITKHLAKEKGIFCGISSGGAVYAVPELAATIDKGVITSTAVTK